MSADLAALRAYVTADGKAGGAKQAECVVLLSVTHSNLKQKFLEIRFDYHTTIESVKERLRSHCGTAVESMRLQLKDAAGRLLCSLDEPGRMLGYYSPQDGYVLHVIDLDPGSLSAGGWLEDTSLVQKYTMSDDDYAKRDDSFRKFKEGKLKADPNWTLAREIAARKGEPLPPPRAAADDDFGAEAAAVLAPGQRCQVIPGDRRGEIKFVGRVDGLAAGYWVGVVFDEPVGKGDGTVKGVRYFECAPRYGGLVRPENVTAGDFPAVDEFASDEEI